MNNDDNNGVSRFREQFSLFDYENIPDEVKKQNQDKIEEEKEKNMEEKEENKNDEN